MDYLKKIGISFIFIISFMIGLSFIVTLLNYINLINNTFLNITKILVPVTSLFIGGFVFGKKSKKKGWLEGLKLSLIFIVLLILFNFLGLHSDFKVKNILFYLILCFSTIFGSMFGISFKKS